MFVLVRVITYVVIFVSIVLIFVPARLMAWVGMPSPAAIGSSQIAGIVIVSACAVVVLWSVLTFAFVGRGTPAPFDPPRRLVIRGPYRFVRNPIYLSAAVALSGAALYYESLTLLGYAGIFILAAHLFVIWYEEPTLRRTFGEEYEAYCRRVRRWVPSVRTARDSEAT